MKILEGFEQGSCEWLTHRCGCVTASEFDNLVTEKWEIRKPSTGMFQSYLHRKLAEKWTGQPVDTFQSYAMEDGNLLEQEGRDWLSFRFGEEITQPALVVGDDNRIACSPDGVIGEEGIEFKCPQSTNQVKYLLANGLPPEYAAQVHFSLAVTGWQRWHFVSYSRRLPKLVLTVERDEKIQAVIKDALAGFLECLDAGYERLCTINGGPPKRLENARKTESKANYSETTGDIIP